MKLRVFWAFTLKMEIKIHMLWENPRFFSFLCIYALSLLPSFFFAESAPPSPQICDNLFPLKNEGCPQRKSVNNQPFLQHASSIWQTSFAPSSALLLACNKLYLVNTWRALSYAPRSCTNISRPSHSENMKLPFRRNIPYPAPHSTVINATFLGGACNNRKEAFWKGS